MSAWRPTAPLIKFQACVVTLVRNREKGTPQTHGLEQDRRRVDEGHLPQPLREVGTQRHDEPQQERHVDVLGPDLSQVDERQNLLAALLLCFGDRVLEHRDT